MEMENLNTSANEIIEAPRDDVNIALEVVT